VEAVGEGRGFLRDCLVVAVDMSRCWFELYQDSPSSPFTLFKKAKKGSKLWCWLRVRDIYVVLYACRSTKQEIRISHLTPPRLEPTTLRIQVEG
jgi:hypothetical protein